MELWSKKRIVHILARNRTPFLVGIILFTIGIIGGYLFYLANPDIIDIDTDPSEIGGTETNPILRGLEEKISFFQELGTGERIGFLFLNNLLVAILSIFLGAILGVFPLFAALLNGFMIGAVSGEIIEGEGVAYLAAGMIPHGVFEIPAVLIAIGLGLKFGYLILHTIGAILRQKPTKDAEFMVFFREIKSMSIVIVIFLGIAAVVEVLITPLVIEMVGG
jgi:stage II sporulation protein M